MAELFRLSHEGNNLSEYSDTTQTQGDITAHADAALFGSYGLRVIVDDSTDKWVERSVDLSSASDFRFRMWFDPNSLTAGSGEQFRFLYTVSNDFTQNFIWWEYQKLGIDNRVALTLFDDDNVPIFQVWNVVTDAPHTLEVKVIRSSGAGVSDASGEFWIDGSSVSTFSGRKVYHSILKTDTFRFGILDRAAGTSGSFFMDEMVLNDDGVPITDDTSPNPSPIAVTVALPQPTANLQLFRITHELATALTDPTAWSQVEVNPDDDLVISADAALAGTLKGLKLILDDMSTFSVRRNFAWTTSVFNIRWYFDPNDSSLSTITETSWLMLRSSTTLKLYFVVRRRPNQIDYEFYVALRDDVGTDQFSPWVTVTNNEHAFEVHVNKAGIFRVWVDDGLVSDLSGLDIDGLALDNMLVGLLASPPLGLSSDEAYFDELLGTQDGTFIGMLPRVLDGIPLAASLPSPAALVSLLVTPSGPSLSGSLPQASYTLGISPAPVSFIASLPQPTALGSLSGVTIGVEAELPSPTALVGRTAAPTAPALTASLPDATVDTACSAPSIDLETSSPGVLARHGADLWYERFEATGFDEAWSEGKTVGSGNTLDEDADTSDIGSPLGWGAQALKAIVGNVSSACRVQHAPSWGGSSGALYLSLDLYVDAFPAAEASSTMFLDVRETLGGVSRPLQASIFRTAGDLKVRAHVDHDGMPHQYDSAPISVGVPYTLQIRWDNAADEWEWSIDGVLQPNNVDASYPVVDPGTLTDSHEEDFGELRIGAALSGGSTDVTLYLDNVAADSTTWVVRDVAIIADSITLTASLPDPVVDATLLGDPVVITVDLPPATRRIFEILHEGGNLSEWTSISDLVNITASPVAALGGTDFGLRIVQVGTTPRFGLRTFSWGANDLYLCWRMDLNGIGLTSDQTELIRWEAGGTFEGAFVGSFFDGKYQVYAWVIEDDSTARFIGWADFPDVPHLVELHFRKGTGSGIFEMWIDGQLAVDNATGLIERYTNLTWNKDLDAVRVGIFSPIPSTINGEIYYDEIRAANEAIVAPTATLPPVSLIAGMSIPSVVVFPSPVSITAVLPDAIGDQSPLTIEVDLELPDAVAIIDIVASPQPAALTLQAGSPVLVSTPITVGPVEPVSTSMTLSALARVAFFEITHEEEEMPPPPPPEEPDIFWPRPILSSPATIILDDAASDPRVSPVSGLLLEIVLELGEDAIICMPEKFTKHVIIWYGRNVQIIGGHFAPVPRNASGTVFSYPFDPNNDQYSNVHRHEAIVFVGQTGIAHIEGCLFGDGPDFWGEYDCVVLRGQVVDGEPRPSTFTNLTCQAQNCRVDTIRGRFDNGGGPGHPDFVQQQGGVNHVRLYQNTVRTQYDGLFLPTKSEGVFNVWGRIDVKKLDIHFDYNDVLDNGRYEFTEASQGITHQDWTMFKRFVDGVGPPFCDAVVPVDFDEVYMDISSSPQGPHEAVWFWPHAQDVIGTPCGSVYSPAFNASATSLSYPGLSPTVTGSIQWGSPVEEFVPVGVAGLSYTGGGVSSPGVPVGWTSESDIGNQITVTAGAALAQTTRGLQAVQSGTEIRYVQKDFTWVGDDLYLRWYVDHNNLVLPDSQTHLVEWLEGGAFRGGFAISFRADPEDPINPTVERHQVYTYLVDDDETAHFAGWVDLPDGEHVLEVHVRRGAGDGLFEMWVDDVLVDSFSNVVFTAKSIDQIRAGFTRLTDPSLSGTVYFDEFVGSPTRFGAIAVDAFPDAISASLVLQDATAIISADLTLQIAPIGVTASLPSPMTFVGPSENIISPLATPGGNDGTIGNPYTWREAGALAAPGSEWFLLEGDYSGADHTLNNRVSTVQSGTVGGGRIKYGSYPGREHPVIHVRTGFPFRLDGSDDLGIDPAEYLEFQEMSFISDDGQGWVRANGTDHVIFCDCFFDGSFVVDDFAGFQANNASYLTLIRNRFGRWIAGDMASLEGGHHYLVHANDWGSTGYDTALGAARYISPFHEGFDLESLNAGGPVSFRIAIDGGPPQTVSFSDGSPAGDYGNLSAQAVSGAINQQTTGIIASPTEHEAPRLEIRSSGTPFSSTSVEILPPTSGVDANGAFGFAENCVVVPFALERQGGSHTQLAMRDSTDSIIRENYFRNPWDRAITITKKNSGRDDHLLVFDGNVIADSDWDNDAKLSEYDQNDKHTNIPGIIGDPHPFDDPSHPEPQDQRGAGSPARYAVPGSIFRNNLLLGTHSGKPNFTFNMKGAFELAIFTSSISYARLRVFHNTIWGVEGLKGKTPTGNAVYVHYDNVPGYEGDDVHFKNNIFGGAVNYAFRVRHTKAGETPIDTWEVSGNLFGPSEDTGTDTIRLHDESPDEMDVATAESTQASFINGTNLAGSPLFFDLPFLEKVRARPQDYSLSSRGLFYEAFSLASGVGKGGGVPLATLTSTASGDTLLSVSDPYYFCDGFGLEFPDGTSVKGDSILIPGNDPVEILSVDHGASQVTVSSPVTAASGTGIYPASVGETPDVGAWGLLEAAGELIVLPPSIGISAVLPQPLVVVVEEPALLSPIALTVTLPSPTASTGTVAPSPIVISVTLPNARLSALVPAFVVARGETTIPAGASLVTLTNGVDYTLEPGQTSSTAFVKLVNSRHTGMGPVSISSPVGTLAHITHVAGDLSEWSSGPVGAGTIDVVSPGLGASSYAMRVSVTTAATLYMEKTLTWTPTTYLRYRFHINPTNFTVGSIDQDQFNLFNLFTGAAQSMGWVRLVKDAGSPSGYSVRSRIEGDDETQYTTGNIPLPNANADNWVEVEVKRASAGGAFDGHLKLWVQKQGTETPDATVTGVNLFGVLPNKFRAGVVSGADAGMTGSFRVDEILVVETQTSKALGPSTKVAPAGFTARIGRPQSLAGSFDIVRPLAASYETKTSWEIIQYVGKTGGIHEIEVRHAGTLPFLIGETVKTDLEVPSILSPSKVLVLITGQTTFDLVGTDWHMGLFTGRLTGAALKEPEFRRGESDESGTVSYAIIEFTGSDWKDVRRCEFTYDEILPWSPEEPDTSGDVPLLFSVGHTSRAFMHAQYRYDQAIGDAGADDAGDLATLDDAVPNAGSVVVRKRSDVDGTLKTLVLWVVEGKRTTTGGLGVVHTAVYDSDTTVGHKETIAAITSVDLDQTSLWGTGASTGGENPPSGSLNFSLRSPSEVIIEESDASSEHWRSFSVLSWPSEPPDLELFVSPVQVTVSPGSPLKVGALATSPVTVTASLPEALHLLTVSPAPVQLEVVLPQATVDRAVLPGAVALSATLPASIFEIGLSPDPVAVDSSLPDAAKVLVVAPNPVSVEIEVPGPGLGATFTLAPVEVTIDPDEPDVLVAEFAFPRIIRLTAGVSQPSAKVDTLLLVSPIAITSVLPSPVLSSENIASQIDLDRAILDDAHALLTVSADPVPLSAVLPDGSLFHDLLAVGPSIAVALPSALSVLTVLSDPVSVSLALPGPLSIVTVKPSSVALQATGLASSISHTLRTGAVSITVRPQVTPRAKADALLFIDPIMLDAYMVPFPKFALPDTPIFVSSELSSDTEIVYFNHLADPQTFGGVFHVAEEDRQELLDRGFMILDEEPLSGFTRFFVYAPVEVIQTVLEDADLRLRLPYYFFELSAGEELDSNLIRRWTERDDSVISF